MLAIATFMLSVSLITGPTNTSSVCCACLPKGIAETDPVSFLRAKPGLGKGKQFITVREKLIELRAHCKKGKLFDGNGREVRFFSLNGCWGNPPEGYQEILERQARELAKLKKRFTVIEMTCNPSGAPIS